MKNFITYLLLISLFPLLCGCKREARSASPKEKVALVVRFFDSMEKRNSQTAVNQGRLIDRNHDMIHVQRLVNIQESNHAVNQAQQLLNRGNVKDALSVINKALLDYPDNDVLRRSKRKLEELQNAPNYFRKIRDARNSSDIADARETITLGLEQNMTPQLLAFLQQCEEKEKELIRQERAKSSSEIKKLDADIRKNLQSDTKRAEESLTETAMREKISEKSEQMRLDAGPVPFENDEVHMDLERASEAAEKLKAEDARLEAEYLRLLRERAKEEKQEGSL